jgi:hypothetical protein
MFLFDRTEYQIGDKVIEYIKYLGHSSLTKGLLSYANNFENIGLKICWALDKNAGAESLTAFVNDGFKKKT